jgi:3-oxoacyl-[acyl-carrier protein] reductase
LVVDVREAAEVDEALERTVAELGPVSIPVNNVGGTFKSPLLETSEKGWEHHGPESGEYILGPP